MHSSFTPSFLSFFVFSIHLQANIPKQVVGWHAEDPDNAFNPLIMDYVNSFIWRYHNQNVRGEEVITRLMNALDE